MPEVPMVDLTQSTPGPVVVDDDPRPCLTIRLPVPTAPALIEVVRGGIDLFSIPPYLRILAAELSGRLTSGEDPASFIIDEGKVEGGERAPFDCTVNAAAVSASRRAVHHPADDMPRLSAWFVDAKRPVVCRLETHRLTHYGLPTLCLLWANKVEHDLTTDGNHAEEMLEEEDARLHGAHESNHRVQAAAV